MSEKYLIEIDKDTYEAVIKWHDDDCSMDSLSQIIEVFNNMVDAVQNGEVVEVKGDLVDRSELEKTADEYLKITSPLTNHCTTYDVYHIIESTKAVVKFDEEDEK